MLSYYLNLQSPLNCVLCTWIQNTVVRRKCMTIFFTLEASQSVFYSRRKCLSGADLRKPANFRKYMNYDNVVIHTWWIVGFDLSPLFSFVSWLATNATSVKPRLRTNCYLMRGMMHFKQKQQLNWNLHFHDIRLPGSWSTSLFPFCTLQRYFFHFSPLKIQLYPPYHLGVYLEGTSHHRCNQESGREGSGLI